MMLLSEFFGSNRGASGLWKFVRTSGDSDARSRWGRFHRRWTFRELMLFIKQSFLETLPSIARFLRKGVASIASFKFKFKFKFAGEDGAGGQGWVHQLAIADLELCIFYDVHLVYSTRKSRRMFCAGVGFSRWRLRAKYLRRMSSADAIWRHRFGTIFTHCGVRTLKVDSA